MNAEIRGLNRSWRLTLGLLWLAPVMLVSTLLALPSNVVDTHATAVKALVLLGMCAELAAIVGFLTHAARDQTLSSGAKAFWMSALIIAAPLSQIAYLAVRSRGKTPARA